MAKYPRTPHLPFSPGGTKDDRKLTSIDHLLGVSVVLSEKMDGSNVCLERQQVFARSHSGPPKHQSFDALKFFHAAVKDKIPSDMQVFGEWLYAMHSIKYSALPSYLMIFGLRTGDVWADWETVEEWADDLGCDTVPVRYRGVFTQGSELQKMVEQALLLPSACGGQGEGSVVRLAGEFQDADFAQSVAKYVRKDHVQTDDHWSSQQIVRNGIRT